ncbi:MAG: hypothetical protein J2P21_00005, partial [Chloracidobacterium sp.]|nr:hypothetical protein [Chloracidobacterium sp.]
MADFICKLGTEIVTRTVEELSELELRQRLAPEGYRIFSIETPGMINGFRGAGARAIKNKHDDFMLYNQAASRPDSSALARLAPTATGPDAPPALAQSEIAAGALGRRGAHQVGQRYVLVQRLATLLR